MPELDSKYRGCMVGLAVGDALGYPVEFMSRREIKSLLGPEGVTDFVAGKHPAGYVSDDTQMSMALARALVEAGHEDLETLMAAVGSEFVVWSRSPENNRAPGNTCMGACAQLARGVPWREAGANDSKGCGTAMRAAPVGLRYHNDRRAIIDIGAAQSLATHGHDYATASSIAVALATDLALAEIAPSEWLPTLLEATGEYGPGFAAKLSEPWQLPGIDLEGELAGIGEGWVAEQAVAAALYCVLQHPDDFRATVLLAANTDGDSDSIACIAGAFSGALNGEEAIPPHWREGVEHPRLHVELADAMHQRWSA